MGLGLEDFIANDDEAKRHTFDLTCCLWEVEAGAAWQQAALDARTDIALVCEYKQWLAEKATCRIKKEIFNLDDGRPPPLSPSAAPIGPGEFFPRPNFG
jgi:hypothetical protein